VFLTKYYTDDQINEEMKGACEHMGETGNANRVLTGKPEGSRSLGTYTRGWKGNIKMDLKGPGWEGMDWIHMAQDKDK